jgi:type IV pilus assembly protein PilM
MPRLSLPTSRRRSPRLVTGLDIEPGAVHAAQVSLQNGLRIERAASAPLEPGIVRDGEVIEPRALAEVLRDLFETHKLDKRVRIGVANQRVMVRHLTLPPIEDPRELATAVHFQAAAELPMPVDQAVLQHISLGVSDTPAGPRQRVLVVAARRDMIERLLGAVREAGLRPEGIDLSAFGMLRALPVQQEGLVLHLAVGGVVNLAVTRDGECVFTRVITGGLEAMAIDMAERRGLPVHEARTALSDAGLPDSNSDTGGEDHDTDQASAQRILADGALRIAGEVRNSLDFHLTADQQVGGSGPATVERLVLTGSGLGLTGLDSALTRHLGLPVERGDVAGADPDAPGSHAVAAGLAIEKAAA